MPDEDKKPNSFDVILEKLQQQEERIKTLENENVTLKKEVTDVTELNRALLNRQGNAQQQKESKPDDSQKKFQDYLNDN